MVVSRYPLLFGHVVQFDSSAFLDFTRSYVGESVFMPFRTLCIMDSEYVVRLGFDSLGFLNHMECGYIKDREWVKDADLFFGGSFAAAYSMLGGKDAGRS